MNNLMGKLWRRLRSLGGIAACVAAGVAVARDGSPGAVLSAGAYNTLVHDVDGQAWAWGYNYGGQFGTLPNSTNPVVLAGLTNVIGVANGGFVESFPNGFTLALRGDGRIYAMGDNRWGQLGNSNTTSQYSPIVLVGLSEVVAVEAGGYHSLALKADGTVWSWGHNAQGQLGVNSFTDRNYPSQVSGLTGVVAISTRHRHNLALKSDGTVWSWGHNLWGALGNGNSANQAVPVQVAGLTNVIAVSAGGWHSLILRADGTVWSCGYDGESELGLGTVGAHRTTVAQISGLTNVVAISAGHRHSLALRADGTAVAWGQNYYGELGDGSTTLRSSPTPVSDLTGIVALSASPYYHSVALDHQGKLYGWGLNNHGQAGTGLPVQNVNSRPAVLTDFAKLIPRSRAHTLLVKSNGRVQVFGANAHGELGTGDQVPRHEPTWIPGLEEQVSVASGACFSVGLGYNGMLRLWGAGALGQQLDGDRTNRWQPHPVALVPGARSVSAGHGHLAVLEADGGLQAAGDNRSGQLGDGSWISRTNPVAVTGLPPLAKAQAGARYMLAVGTNGSVYAWGDNLFGQLGDGTLQNRNTPQAVAGLTGIASVAAGRGHSLALTSGGTLRVWGDNRHGQLGDGTLTRRLTPVSLSSPTGVVAIACAGDTSYAVTAAGAVWAWGRNDYGQVGDGTLLNRSVPTLITNVPGFRSVETGDDHVTIVLNDNTALVWGANQYGQLGAESLFRVPTPQWRDDLAPPFSPETPAAAARLGRFSRGTGSDLGYLSTVTPVDFQKGVALDDQGGNGSLLFPGNDWTNLFYHWNATNPPAPLSFKNPIVAFGSSAGGTPLLTGRSYSFNVTCGDLALDDSESGPTFFSVTVYARTNMQRLGDIPITVPSTASAGYGTFVREGVVVDSQEYGLRTEIRLLSQPRTVPVTYQVTHLARNTDLCFVVNGFGYASKQDTDYDGRTDAEEVFEGTNPFDPASCRQTRLAHWSFEGLTTTNQYLVGDRGQLASLVENLSQATGQRGSAVLIDYPLSQYSAGAKLFYRELERNGAANINLRKGSVRMWFKPNWTPTSGPLGWGRLIEVGQWSADNRGVWQLNFDNGITYTNKPPLYFTSASAGSVYSPIVFTNFPSSGWHQLVLTYAHDAPTNQARFYLDGSLVASGSGQILVPPKIYRDWTGIKFGNDWGSMQARGWFDEIETFNYPLGAAEISAHYAVTSDPATRSGTWNRVTLGQPSLPTISLTSSGGSSPTVPTIQLGTNAPYTPTRGIGVVRLNSSGAVLGSTTYATDNNATEGNNLAAVINSAADGTIFLFATYQQPNNTSGLLKEALWRLGFVYPYQWNSGCSWLGVAQKGRGHCWFEKVDASGGAQTLVSGTFDATAYFNAISTARSGITWNPSNQWVREPLYVMGFERSPEWRATILEHPSFQGEPLPPSYLGKSSAELLANAATLPVLSGLTPTNYLQINHSPELRSHPALDRLVTDLRGDPIALANYVVNEIELTDALDYSWNITQNAALDAGGVDRSALATLQEGRGSPIEQCGLLVYLLRKAGIPALYVFPQQNSTKLLSSQVDSLLRTRVSAMTNIPVQVPVNYPWVAAHVGGAWQQVFPWLKDVEVTEGFALQDVLPPEHADAYSWAIRYLENDPAIMGLATSDQPQVLYPAFLRRALAEQAPGVSLDDVGVRSRVRKHRYERWQDFPRPFALSGTPVFREQLLETPDIFNTISLTVSSDNNPAKELFTQRIRMAELHNRKLFARWEKESATTHRLLLTLGSYDGVLTNVVPFRTSTNGTYNTDGSWAFIHRDVLTNVAAADDMFTVRIYHRRARLAPDYIGYYANKWDYVYLEGPDLNYVLHGRIYEQLQKVRKGDAWAFVPNFGSVAPQMLDAHVLEINAHAKRMEASTNAVPDLDILNGTLLHLVGQSYWEFRQRFESSVAAQQKIARITGYGHGFALLRAQRDAYGNLINGGEVRANEPVLNICSLGYATMFNGTARPDGGQEPRQANLDFFLLDSVQGSAAEHHAINGFFGFTNSFSTVRLLQLNGKSSFLRLNVSNYASFQTVIANQDPGLWGKVANLFDPTVADRDANRAFVTSQKINLGAGSGSGVFALWSHGGAGAYISGGFNGGIGLTRFANDYKIRIVRQQLDERTTSVYVTYSDGEVEALLFPADAPDWYINKIVDGQLRPSAGVEVAAVGTPHGIDTSNVSGQVQALQVQFNYSSFGSEAGHDVLNELVGDPVNMLTGSFYVDDADLVLPGPFPLALRRNYSSQSFDQHNLGTGWKLAHSAYLGLHPNITNLIHASEADGTVIAFRYAGTNTWLPTLADNPMGANLTTSGAGGAVSFLNHRLVYSESGGQKYYRWFAPGGSIRTFRVRSFPVASYLRERPYLETWTDPLGNELAYEYGLSAGETDYGQVRRIVSSSGALIVLRYDGWGRIVECLSNDGRRVRYVYDKYNDLTAVVRPDNSRLEFKYQHKLAYGQTNTWEDPDTGEIFITGYADPYWYSTHLLETETKPDGRILQNVYDDKRRVVQQSATVGPDSRLVVNARFAYTNNFINALSNLPLSGVTVVTDALGGAVRYDYTNSLITKITHQDGTSTTQEWYSESPPAGGYPRSLFRRTNQRGLTAEFKYDSRGNITNTVTTGDLRGLGATNETAVTTAIYTTNNLVQVQVDALGHTNRYFYDGWKLLRTEYWPNGATAATAVTNTVDYVSVTNVLTYGSTIVTNRAFGLPWRTTTGAGSADAAVAELAFDGRGFLTARTNYTGSADPNVFQILVHNARGELIEAVDAVGRAVRQAYDDGGRPVYREVFEAGATRPLVWEYTYYNENGEVTWQDGPRYNPEDYVWHDYDGGGREIEQVRWRSRARADGSGVEAETGDNLYSAVFREHDAFGNLIKTRDQLGNFTVMEYDAVGRMIGQRRHSATNAVPVTAESFAYEPGGQVAVHTNALNGVTRSFYTSTGKLKQRINPDGTTNSWTFDLLGRVLREYQSNGHYWETTYDDVNRRVTRTFSADSGNTEVSVLDRRGNVVIRTNAVGAVFTTAYDDLNRPKLSVGPAVNGVTQFTTNSYDASGRWTKSANALGEYAVTYLDAAGRAVTNEVRDATDTLVRRNVTLYAADGHSVMSVAGSGTAVLTNVVFTDTFGKPVLAHSFPSAGVTNLTRNLYDIVGNLVQSVDELGQTNRLSYDALYRLQSQATPDGATTSFGYDAAGNLTNRTMPGGLVWSATYDSVGRKTAEQLAGGATVSRQFTYGYFGSGANRGLLQTTVDVGRTVTNSLSYDGLFRVVTNAWAGTQPEHALTNVYAYDRRGLVTNLTQTSAVGVSTAVGRTYDLAGQTAVETVTLNGATHSSFSQGWNAAGRRAGLTAVGTPMNWGFQYQADGLLTEVDAYGESYLFDYDTAGLLVSRSNRWRTRSFAQRDGRGRPLTIYDYVGANTALTETLTWRADSKLNSYAATRLGVGAWNESRSFAYNSRGQLTSEGIGVATGSSATATHSYDASLLGVHTGMTLSGALANNWSVNGALDALGRVPKETVNLTALRLRAVGSARGASGVALTLDGSPAGGVQFNPLSADGRWTLDTTLGTGNHTLAAVATNAFTGTTVNANSTFTVLAQNQITNTYDGAGNVSVRTLTGGKTMTLKWDGLGRLHSVRQVDTGNNGYDWTAFYDGLGRRLRTTKTDLTNNLPVAGSTVTADSYYDPQVEFLEVGVNVNGTNRTWQVLGPDLAGGYGGRQGIGGLEAVVREADGQTQWLLSDHFGHTLAGGTQTNVTWSGTRVGGYGPVVGYQVPVLGGQFGVAETTLWRSRRIDPTGFYWFGARYYDAAGGRWLSPDPLGHASSPSLYDYAGNDPVNGADPTGRFTMRDTFGPGGTDLTYELLEPAPPGALDVGMMYVDSVISQVGKIIRSSLEAAGHAHSMVAESRGIAGSFLNVDQANAAFLRYDQHAEYFRSQAEATWNLYEANLQVMDGNRFNAANATLNPLWGAAAGSYESYSGLSVNPYSIGGQLNLQQRVDSAAGATMSFVETAGLAYGVTQLGSALLAAKTTTVFRVESAANARLIIGEGGTVATQGDNMLFLNFGQQARAESFLARRLEQGYEGTTIKSFEVPTSFVDRLRGTSVLESEAHLFPDAPLRVDVKYADQFGLRTQQMQELQQVIIQGTGRTP